MTTLDNALCDLALHPSDSARDALQHAFDQSVLIVPLENGAIMDGHTPYGHKISMAFTDQVSLQRWQDQPITSTIMPAREFLQRAAERGCDLIFLNPGGEVVAIIPVKPESLEFGQGVKPLVNPT